MLIPRHPGVLSAAGLLAAPIEHEVAIAFPRPLAGVGFADVRGVLDELDRACARLMAEEKIGEHADCRSSIPPMSGTSASPITWKCRSTSRPPIRCGRLYRDFLALHDRIYGHATEQPAAIVNLRSVHRAGGSDHLDEGAYRPLDGDAAEAATRDPCRRCACAGEAAIYHRAGNAGGPDLRRPRDRGTGRHDDAGRAGLARHRAGQRQPAADARLTWTSIPITLEVLRNKLDGIANEMQLTLVRSAFSAIVKEGLDASASLFTLQGETLAQALAIPVHLGALTPMVGRLLQDVPLDTMGEGDIWILNDTYLGGTHLPDIAIMMPVFADGRVIAISAAMTHHQDVGGMAPGSTPTNATEIFQEGIRIPLLQFRRGDALNDTLIAMLRQNVRLPDVLMGDINAQVAACTIGARRLGRAGRQLRARRTAGAVRRTAEPLGDDDAPGAAQPAARAPIAMSITSTTTASNSTGWCASRSR